MKEDRIYLLHIKDAIDHILSYTSDGQRNFLKDNKTQDAVVRNFEIIGEATKNISQKLRTAHHQIPWKKMAGLRDKIIHEYFGVNIELIWDVVENKLPELKKNIDSILKSLS